MERFLAQTTHIPSRNRLDHLAMMFKLGRPTFVDLHEEGWWISYVTLDNIECDGKARQLREARNEACEKWVQEFAKNPRDDSHIVTSHDKRATLKEIDTDFHVIYNARGFPSVLGIRGDDYLVVNCKSANFTIDSVLENVSAYFAQMISLDYLKERYDVECDGILNDDAYAEGTNRFFCYTARKAHELRLNPPSPFLSGRLRTSMFESREQQLLAFQDEYLGDNEMKAQILTEAAMAAYDREQESDSEEDLPELD